MRALAVIGILFASACAHQARAPQLEQIWRTAGFSSPESITPSVDGNFFYVSNVNGEGDVRDGNGFISRVSPDGAILTREWATGLHAPKGLALRDGALYVSDIDHVVIFDAVTGAERERHAAEGARFLNDLAFTPRGELLIADSGTQKLYVLSESGISTWLEHELLNSINGILPERERLLVTTMRGRLLAIDYGTKAISVLAEGLDQADGVARLSADRYIVTAWPGQAFAVNAQTGISERILDTREEPRFLNDILRVGNTLYVPHWEPGELTAYRIRD